MRLPTSHPGARSGVSWVGLRLALRGRIRLSLGHRGRGSGSSKFIHCGIQVIQMFVSRLLLFLNLCLEILDLILKGFYLTVKVKGYTPQKNNFCGYVTDLGSIHAFGAGISLYVILFNLVYERQILFFVPCSVITRPG
jgi:hypothetical protein